jgi:beta-phosphoglucomutase-like phosphatase (HAD superfamily)
MPDMNKIKAVAFDLEGTVIDNEYVHHKAHINSASDVGLNLSLDYCLKQLPHFIGGPDEEVAKEISQIVYAQLGKEVDYEAILESKREHYDQLLRELPIRPRMEFLDVFYELRNMGLKYAIGSSADEEHAITLLTRGGLFELFGRQNMVFREDVQNSKPAPDVWIETAKRMSVEPESQLVFEDSPRGITGAIQVGAYCIGMPVYNKPNIIRELVDAGAKRIFMGWDEINTRNLVDNINQER